MADHPLAPAVFLDRDDTLIVNRDLPASAFAGGHRGDLASPEHVVLLPGVAGALTRLDDAGFILVCITNQGAVARGNATLDQVRATNDRLRALTARPDGSPRLAAVLSCPYHPSGRVARFTREHPWRKPNPGMLLHAARHLRLDLPRSWLVGDAPRDLEAGRAADLPDDRVLLVGPGAPLPGLSQAAERILQAS